MATNLPFQDCQNKRLINGAPAEGDRDYVIASQIQGGDLLWGGTSGGTGNAQTLTLVPAITAYITGQQFTFKSGNTNTGPTTLNINGLGTKAIRYQSGGEALRGGELPANYVAIVTYDGTDFILNNPATYGLAPASVTYSSVINTPSTSPVTATGLSIAIAPSNNEKVIIMGSMTVSHGTINEIVKAQLYRDSTAIGVQQNFASHRGNTGGQDGCISMQWIDSGLTAGSTYTYTVKWNVDSGTAYSRWGSLAIHSLRLS